MSFLSCTKRRSVLSRFAVVVCLLLSAVAQVEHADEDQVKAAYLYNFVKFVDWPANRFSGASDPTIICSIGDQRLAEILQQTVQRKAVKGRPIEAREVRDDGQIKACHILLITFQDRARILEALRSAQACNVLTVGQNKEFTRLGGMINLVRNESNIELEINPKAAEAEGLKISSRLLAVSRVVTGGGTT
ncbi:MAG TPA: YfiR family protein [Candidatus Solibacter sp.]|nr:YfiR family protein [Candidatus Solibacter sp.]